LQALIHKLNNTNPNPTEHHSQASMETEREGHTRETKTEGGGPEVINDDGVLPQVAWA
jgi:hypothetical protein